MNVFTKCCVVLTFVSVFRVSEQREFISPCPEVFTYYQDGLTWVGRVELPGANIDNDLNLEVVLSLKRPLPSDFQGYITLKDDLTAVIQNIIFERKITYIVNFPLKVEIPSIVSITFNGQKYCDGVKPKRYATIIQLEHKNQLKQVYDVPTTLKIPKATWNRPAITGSRTTKPSIIYSTRTRSTLLKPSRKPINLSPVRMTHTTNNPRSTETWHTPTTESEKVTDDYEDYGNIFSFKDENIKPTEPYQVEAVQKNTAESSVDLYEEIIDIKPEMHQNEESNVRPNKQQPAAEPNANSQSKDKTSDSSDYSEYFNLEILKMQDDKQSEENAEESGESKTPESENFDYAIEMTEKQVLKPVEPIAQYIEDFINKFEEDTKRLVKKEPQDSEDEYEEENGSEIKGVQDVPRDSEEAYDSA